MTTRHNGTLFVFLAAILYSTAGLCMKFIPWGGLALNSGRSIIALAVYGLFILCTHHKLKFNRWVLLGSIAICGTNTLFAIANKMTTAANSIVLQYTAPIFVIVLSALFLHRKVKRLDLMTCTFVFFGVLCFFIESLSGGNLMGDLIALISGVAYAGVFLHGEMPEGDALSALFFGTIISAVIGIPYMFSQPALNMTGWISMVFLGVFQMGLAFICLTVGLKTTPPVTASLVTAIEPVLNPVLVAIFYGEVMGPLSIIGATIVVGTVITYNVILGKEKVGADSAIKPRWQLKRIKVKGEGKS